MLPFLAVMASVLANRMQQDEARKQALIKAQVQRIQELDPGRSMYGLQAAQLKSAEGGQNRAMLAMLPFAFQGLGNTEPDRSSTGYVSGQLNAANDKKFGAVPVPRANGAYQVNPFQGLGADASEQPELPIYGGFGVLDEDSPLKYGFGGF